MSNITNNQTDELVSFPFEIYMVPAITICSILGTLGLFGNFAILTLTILSKQLRSTCHVFFSILALSDFANCVAFMHRLIILGSEPMNRFECFLKQSYGYPPVNLTMAMMITIAVDRILAIRKPLLYVCVDC